MPTHDPFQSTTAEAEAAMIIRLREDNQGAATTDILFDGTVDSLWSLLRDRLAGWTVYGRSALDFLDQDPSAPSRSRGRAARVVFSPREASERPRTFFLGPRERIKESTWRSLRPGPALPV
jgi:hypothetical protein